jgi:hypothetical protein
MMGGFLFRTRPKSSGARLIAGPFKAHSNRAFRCIATSAMGYKQCELAARFVAFYTEIQFTLRHQLDVVSLLEADLIRKSF